MPFRVPSLVRSYRGIKVHFGLINDHQRRKKLMMLLLVFATLFYDPHQLKICQRKKASETLSLRSSRPVSCRCRCPTNQGLGGGRSLAHLLRCWCLRVTSILWVSSKGKKILIDHRFHQKANGLGSEHNLSESGNLLSWVCMTKFFSFVKARVQPKPLLQPEDR